MKVSPHCHIEDQLTGSTLVSFVKRAKELNREYFAFTCHGHLSSALKAYNLCKKSGLKCIPGIEIYFKDFIFYFSHIFNEIIKILLHAKNQKFKKVFFKRCVF